MEAPVSNMFSTKNLRIFSILNNINLLGGQMADVATSPDPVFFLHHTFLDRVWWQWQEEDLETRLTDITGYTSEYEPSTGWVNVTLDFEIDMFAIIPNATVGEVMDVRGSLLCYE
ncbi:hypothetical protein RUND412_009538 [Rhizina undulata]